MTTDKRQVRLLISAILESHKIDDLALEAKLTDGIVNFYNATQRGDNPVRTRISILENMLEHLDRQRAHDDMNNRIARAVKVTPNGSDTWNRVVKWCSEMEKQGQTIERYAEWMRSDKYNSPKVAQIAMNPLIIKDTWAAAFPANEVTQISPDGGMYV